MSPFDTSLLDAAIQQQRREAETNRQTTLAAVLDLLDEYGPVYGIGEAYVFGSLSRPGRFDAASDVDIAVEQIDPTYFFEAIGEFARRLGREVDLVELSRCHFAQRIREQGVRWIRKS